MSPARRRSARLAKTASPVKAANAAPQLGPVSEEEIQYTSVSAIPTSKKSRAKKSSKVASTPSVNEPDQTSDKPRTTPPSAIPTVAAPASTRKIGRPATFAMDMPQTPRHELSANPLPSTPLNSSAIKPPRSEMHPSKMPHMAHSGLHLGFADLKPATLEAARTPTKGPPPTPLAVPSSGASAPPPSSPFTFRFSSRPEELQMDHSSSDGQARNEDVRSEMGLSGEAMRMMAELQGEAAKIRAELATQKEVEEQSASAQSERRIAKPRGRFSAAHQVMFDKMKSIKNHPSAWRLNRSPSKPDAEVTPAQSLRRSPSKPNVAEPAANQGLKRTLSKVSMHDKETPATVRKSLKRTQSKANLNETDNTTTTTFTPVTPSLKRTLSKANLADKPTSAIPTPAQRSLKRTLSKANLNSANEIQTPKQVTPLPAKSQTAVQSRIPAPGSVATPSVKRLKTRFEDDASSNRPVAPDGDGDATSLARTPTASRTPARSMIARSMHSTLARPGTSTVSMTPGPHLMRRTGISTVAAGSQTEKVYKMATPSRFSQIRANIQARLAEARSSGAQASTPTTTSLAPTPKTQDTAAQATPTQPPAVSSSAAGTPTANRDKPFPTLPSVPTSTPSRSLFKRMQFTPKTEKAVLSQESPTPMKIGPTRAALELSAAKASATPSTVPKISATPATALKTSATSATPTTAFKVSVTPATVSKISATPTTVSKRPTIREVTYPDLSKYPETLEPTPVKKDDHRGHLSKEEMAALDRQQQARMTPRLKSALKATATAAKAATPSVPGTFTFRSDQTIDFQSPSSTGFGAVKGQSSVRQVRPSVHPAVPLAAISDVTSMPGAFPEALSDKENSVPPTPSPVKVTAPENGIPHGLQGKKRARSTWEEEEAQIKQDEERRAAKRQRAAHPAGAELFTTARTMSSPIKARPMPKTPNQPVPAKKKPFMSISRLNVLAQPKNRR